MATIEDEHFNALENLITNNMGSKLTLSGQIQQLKVEIWHQFLDRVNLNSEMDARAYVTSRCNNFELRPIKVNREFCESWLTYIKLCKSKTDLFDCMNEHGVGTFFWKSIDFQARFFESEGDPQEDELNRPIMDLRRANKVYLDGL
jgi:hypothetical protein